jgi:hypothetical protein
MERHLKTGGSKSLNIEGYPSLGTPAEVLKYHGLDGASLAKKVRIHHDKSGLEMEI